MAKQVCDLRPGKGFTTGQSNEHLRNYKVYDTAMKKFGFFDPTREGLNFEVGKGGIVTPVNKNLSIPTRIKTIMKERRITDPNEGLESPTRRSVANIILGGSRNQMLKLAFGDQDVDLSMNADNRGVVRKKEIEEWAVAMYKFISKKYGEENIAAFVVHLDEKNPHAHVTLLPVVGNRISWNEVFGGSISEGSRKFKELHDEIAEVNKSFDLERGDDVKVTGNKHRTTEEYMQWLKEACDSAEQSLGEKQKTLKEMAGEIRKAETRVKGLSTMVGHLEERKTEISEEIERLEERAQRGEVTNEELQQQKEKLLKELNDIGNSLDDKKKKLAIAERQLDELAQKKRTLQDKYDELQRQLNKDLPRQHDRVLRDMNSIAWMQAAEEAKARYQEAENFARTLPSEDRKRFDNIFEGSIFEDLSERANEIVAVAAALFLGYIDQATSFAKSNGGGGGSPGTGWGRKKDEDDEAWKRRCFIMGRWMMRPAGRKLKR